MQDEICIPFSDSNDYIDQRCCPRGAAACGPGNTRAEEENRRFFWGGKLHYFCEFQQKNLRRTNMAAESSGGGGAPPREALATQHQGEGQELSGRELQVKIPDLGPVQMFGRKSWSEERTLRRNRAKIQTPQTRATDHKRLFALFQARSHSRLWSKYLPLANITAFFFFFLILK